MPPIETLQTLSITEDIPNNGLANSNSASSSSLEQSGSISSSASPSGRHSFSPEVSDLFRMFQEFSINIPSLNSSLVAHSSRFQRIVIPREQTLLDLLKQASHGEDVFYLKEVKLKVVASSVSLSTIGFHCPDLVVLHLCGSVLSSLRDIGTSLRYLKILDVSKCGLTSLDGTFGLTSLHEMNASDNKIEHLGPCAQLQNLRLLNIERNRIQNLKSLSFLSICPKLVELSIIGNPICKFDTYRESVIEMLPNLRIFDKKTQFQNKSSDLEENHSESDSFSHSIDISSLTEPNSDDFEEAPEVLESEYMTKENKAKVFNLSKRPATSSGLGYRRSLNHTLALPRRPKSANIRTHSIAANENLDSSLQVSPSVLTSGYVVCGNIGRALLKSRGNVLKRMNSGDKDNKDFLDSLHSSNKREFLFCSLPTKIKTKKDVDLRNPRFETVNKLLKQPLPEKPQESTPVVELEFGVTGLVSSESEPSTSTKDVLTAAKKWRRAFQLFRTKNNFNISQSSNEEESKTNDISVTNYCEDLEISNDSTGRVMQFGESEPD